MLVTRDVKQLLILARLLAGTRMEPFWRVTLKKLSSSEKNEKSATEPSWIVGIGDSNVTNTETKVETEADGRLCTVLWLTVSRYAEWPSTLWGSGMEPCPHLNLPNRGPWDFVSPNCVRQFCVHNMYSVRIIPLKCFLQKHVVTFSPSNNLAHAFWSRKFEKFNKNNVWPKNWQRPFEGLRLTDEECH